MINLETGNPHTAHTTNPVPFIITLDPKEWKFVEDKKVEEAEKKDERVEKEEKKEEEKEEKKKIESATDEDPGALCDVAPTILGLLGVPKPEGELLDFFHLRRVWLC